MKLKITISVDEGLRNEVAELAAVEQRNFSQMWGVLAREALDFRREPAGTLTEPGVSEGRRAASAATPEPVGNTGLSPGSVSVSRVLNLPDEPLPSEPVLMRSGICPHRNPPGTFCKWGCDG